MDRGHPFNLRECVTSALDLIAAVRPRRRPVVSTVYGDFPAVISGALRGCDVLLNCCRTSQVTTRQRHFEGRAGRPRLRFSVRDSGLGLRGGIAKLFQRFSQAASSTTRSRRPRPRLATANALRNDGRLDDGRKRRPRSWRPFRSPFAHPPSRWTRASRPQDRLDPARPSVIRCASSSPSTNVGTRSSRCAAQQWSTVRPRRQRPRALDPDRASAYDVVLMDVQMPEMDVLDASRRIMPDGGRGGASHRSMTANQCRRPRGVLGRPLTTRSPSHPCRCSCSRAH